MVLSFESGRPLRLPVFMPLAVSRRTGGLVQPLPVVQACGWALGADTSGSPQIFEVECTSCHDRCDPSNDEDSAERDQWCLRHARETGHTGYREIWTGFLRVVAHAAEGRGQGEDT